jgi:GNAT superfamily N-acetyltransferase
MTIAFADAALARRVEAGWAWASGASARAVAARRPELGAAWERFGGGTATFFGPGSPLSQAQGIGLDGPVDPAELDGLDAWFDARGAGPAVAVATLADPGLLPALSRRGYHVAETTHMLVCPLGSEPASEHAPAHADPPAPLVVVRVDLSDRATREAVAAVVLRGFFDEHGEPPSALADVMDMLLAADGTSLWLARFEAGADAGGASLLVHDGLALFAGDATLPACRRRGAQSALIRARLAEAARLGCDLAVTCVQPGSASQRNYERQAFRMAYARVLMTREPRESA